MKTTASPSPSHQANKGQGRKPKSKQKSPANKTQSPAKRVSSPKRTQTTTKSPERPFKHKKSSPHSPSSTATTTTSTFSTPSSARSTESNRARAKVTSSAMKKMTFDDTPLWQEEVLIHDPSIDMFNVNLKSPYQCWNIIIGNDPTYTMDQQIGFFTASNHDDRLEDVCNSFEDPQDLRTLYKATCSRILKATKKNPLRNCKKWSKSLMCSEIIKLVNDNWDALGNTWDWTEDE